MSTKKYCLNGGDCYYLIDEDIVSCNCTWLYGGKRCEKYITCGGSRLEFKIEKDVKVLI